MTSFELISLVLLIVAAIAIVVLVGPASLGALAGSAVAIGVMRVRGGRRP